MTDYDTWSSAKVLTHIRTRHQNQLPSRFQKRGDVSWDAVHNLLHRLAKWKEWSHT